MQTPARSFAPAIAASAALSAAFVPAFFSGGFFDTPRLVTAICVWAVLAVVFAVAHRPWPRTRAQAIAVSGLAGLAIWTLASVSWAPIAGRAEDDAQRIVLYLGLLLLGLVALRPPAARSWLEPTLLVGLITVCAVGLSERLLPDLVQLERSQTAAGRLEQPLTYWNGMGLVAAWAWLVGARLAGDATRSRRLRTIAASTLPVAGLTLYLTFSRAGIAAAVAGTVVLAALSPYARSQLAALTVGGVATAVAAMVANRLPTVRSLEPGTVGNPDHGHLMLAVLVALSAVCALATWFSRSRPAQGSRSVPVKRAALVAGVTLVALIAAAIAAAVSDVRPSSESPVRGATPERLQSIDTNRYAYWKAAIEMAKREPLRGEGAGSFAAVWRARPKRPDRAVDAHSLYLETVAELGIVGAAALLSFLGGVISGALGALRRHPTAAIGPLAVLVSWLVHAGVDWDWELPGATAPALLASAALLAWSEPDRRARTSAEPLGAQRAVDAEARARRRMSATGARSS